MPKESDTDIIQKRDEQAIGHMVKRFWPVIVAVLGIGGLGGGLTQHNVFENKPSSINEKLKGIESKQDETLKAVSSLDGRVSRIEGYLDGTRYYTNR